VRNLDRYVRGRRENVIHEGAGLSRAVRSLPRDRRAEVHDDGHPVCVRGSKDAPQLPDVLRVREVDVGVAEVQLEAVLQLRSSCASGDLVERVVLQGVHATKRAQAAGERCDLLARPVVLGPDLRVLVLDGRAVRVAELVGLREHHRPPDPRRVQERHEVARRHDRRRQWRR
jgi:hypothetical protein